jgi:plasmid maintenance system antidote protein VapI
MKTPTIESTSHPVSSNSPRQYDNLPKLNFAWAECIRECVNAGMTQQSIAKKLRVHRSRISLIVARTKYGFDLDRERLECKIDRLERELLTAMEQMVELKRLRDKQRRAFPLRRVTGNMNVPTKRSRAETERSLPKAAGDLKRTDTPNSSVLSAEIAPL